MMGADSGIAPEMQIKVNGVNLSPTAVADVVSVTVLEDLGAPGMFTLELLNWDSTQLRVSWSDSTLFKLGASVQVALGYVNAVERWMAGEITGLEPEFESSQIPKLTVRGYDRRHRMMRDRKTR